MNEICKTCTRAYCRGCSVKEHTDMNTPEEIVAIPKAVNYDFTGDFKVMVDEHDRLIDLGCKYDANCHNCKEDCNFRPDWSDKPEKKYPMDYSKIRKTLKELEEHLHPNKALNQHRKDFLAKHYKDWLSLLYTKHLMEAEDYKNVERTKAVSACIDWIKNLLKQEDLLNDEICREYPAHEKDLWAMERAYLHFFIGESRGKYFKCKSCKNLCDRFIKGETYVFPEVDFKFFELVNIPEYFDTSYFPPQTNDLIGLAKATVEAKKECITFRGTKSIRQSMKDEIRTGYFLYSPMGDCSHICNSKFKLTLSNGGAPMSDFQLIFVSSKPDDYINAEDCMKNPDRIYPPSKIYVKYVGACRKSSIELSVYITEVK